MKDFHRYCFVLIVLGLSGVMQWVHSLDDSTSRSELWPDDPADGLDAHQRRIVSRIPLPYTYIDREDLPSDFSWKSQGVACVNQHLPGYCGSCFIQATLSALADRIKIAQQQNPGVATTDIHLSAQYILNCGTSAGSCSGGSMYKVYRFIKHNGFVPYETCQPYMACSSDSTEGFCPFIDTTCNAMNTCRTCRPDGVCTAVETFPNATIADLGRYDNVTDVHIIKAEIFARGPVAAGIHGRSIHEYQGGIFNDTSAPTDTTHAVSIVGWGVDPASGQEYWEIRNSWGQYWGEMGFFRVLMGQNVLGIESSIVWATPGSFTVVSESCSPDGSSCSKTEKARDPYLYPSLLAKRLDTVEQREGS